MRRQNGCGHRPMNESICQSVVSHRYKENDTNARLEIFLFRPSKNGGVTKPIEIVLNKLLALKKRLLCKKIKSLGFNCRCNRCDKGKRY
jgi:hypothetical protein